MIDNFNNNAIDHLRNFWGKDCFTEEEIDEFYNLNLPSINPGDHIRIYWKDFDENDFDKGYAMILPDCSKDFDCGNFIVHIPQPVGVEKGDAEEVFIHIVHLALNSYVKKIEIDKKL